MAAFVLDASVVLAATLPGEVDADIASDILSRVPVDGAWVPGLWPVEVGNAVLRRIRRGLLDETAADAILERLRALPVVIDPEGSTRALIETFQIAAQYGLTLYDGCYLELALRRSLPLATVDKALRRAAQAAGTALVNPTA